MDETQPFLFCHLGRCFLSLVIDMCSRWQKYSLKNFHLIYSPLCEVKAWEVVTIPFPRTHLALDEGKPEQVACMTNKRFLIKYMDPELLDLPGSQC